MEPGKRIPLPQKRDLHIRRAKTSYSNAVFPTTSNFHLATRSYASPNSVICQHSRRQLCRSGILIQLLNIFFRRTKRHFKNHHLVCLRPSLSPQTITPSARASTRHCRAIWDTTCTQHPVIWGARPFRFYFEFVTSL